jgi:hypothetical protein
MTHPSIAINRMRMATRSLLASAVVWAAPHRAHGADDETSAESPASDSSPTAFSKVTDQPPINLDPVIVNAAKLPGILGKVFGYSWNVSELTGGSNFHIRQGELVDAIGFRHLYLAKHPQERAIVVVVMAPPDNHVTQAAAAYTEGQTLHLKSAALGDIRPSGLTIADIDHPEKIRRYMQDIRDAYLGRADSLVTSSGGEDQTAIDRATGGTVLVTTGMLIARAEETGNYSGISMFGGQPVYRGSADDMLVSAFYWLNETDKVGLIPVARSKVNVFVSNTLPQGGTRVETVVEDGVVFDWDGVHYLYNDQGGTVGIPIPRNPVTGAPYLVLRNGDLLEALYFLASYAKQHPAESEALIHPANGAPAAVFTRSGRLWMMSPFLGRFVMLPMRFKIGQTGALEIVHRALIQREMKRLPAGTSSRPVAGLPQALPGDSWNEQVRRAYLAFKELGVPVKFVENMRRVPGLQVNYRGTEYSYFSPEVSGGAGPNG